VFQGLVHASFTPRFIFFQTNKPLLSKRKMIGYANVDDYDEDGDIGSAQKQPFSPVDSDTQEAEYSQETELINKTIEKSSIESNTSSVSSNAAASSDIEQGPPAETTGTPVDPVTKIAEEVEGFQMVQATGLTDTSTPSPKGSNIPDFATATPSSQVPKFVPPPTDFGFAPQSLPAARPNQQTVTPLEDNSKAQQFNQRFDVLQSDFST
jgi:hypothetical protein